MQTVFKYTVPFGKEVRHEMPAFFRVVHVGHQSGVPTFWALLDPEEIKVAAFFIVCGTGQPMPNAAVHVGTYQEGSFVWHIFRIPASASSEIV